MRAGVELALTVLGVLLVVPAFVLALECVAAAFPLRRAKGSPDAAGRVTVLIPAHDEQSGIGATVVDLVGQLAAGDQLIVVADNCTDDTAGAARRAVAASGASPEVADRVRIAERSDPDNRGKGHAIAFGLAAMDDDPPDVVVIVDADCRVAPGGVRTLAGVASATGRPVQADYLLAAPARPSPLAQIGALAILVRNRVRPRGLARLGLPCQLTGSGMAFPWAVLRTAPSLGSQIVEDLVLGLELALAGRAAVACPQVLVTSVLPDADADAAKQRRRWEHGQMATLLAYAPKLIGRGLARANLGLVALGLDLAVPPLALLCMLVMAQLGVAVAWRAFGGGSAPLAAGGIALGLVAVAVALAWARFGRRTISAAGLALAPLYVLWKIPLYFAFLVRREKAWNRTRRAGEPPNDEDTPA